MIKRLLIKVFVTLSAAVLFFVVAVGCGEQESYIPEITGVYALDVEIRYDGAAHSIEVKNTLEGDEIYYSSSSNGPWRENNITYVAPGDYTVYYKVVRGGCDDLTASAKISISRGILTGIYADDVVYVYDGKPHGITVHGLSDAENIIYSVDGEHFSSELELTEPGEYIIYYRVSNDNCDYFDDCTVSILPDITGTYVNFESGIIIITDAYATVDGIEYVIEYDVNGKGYIGERAFEAYDGSIDLGGEKYEKINENDLIYELTIGDLKTYAVADGQTEITVDFDGLNAVVDICGNAIRVFDVNYCEGVTGGIISRNYDNNNVTVCVDAPVEYTEVSIELSWRERLIVEFEPITVLYDGKPHGPTVEFDGEVLYLNGDTYSSDIPVFTDIGRYESEVLLISDEYLPERKNLIFYIIDDYSGVYYTDEKVIEINGFEATVNGESQPYEHVDGKWMLCGRELSESVTGIVIDGDQYKRIEENRYIIAVVSNDGVLILFNVPYLEIRVYENEIKVFVEDKEAGKFVAFDGITVTVNGKAALGVTEDGYTSYIVGVAEYTGGVVTYVGIECG